MQLQTTTIFWRIPLLQVYIATFSLGMGAIPWIIMSEVSYRMFIFKSQMECYTQFFSWVWVLIISDIFGAEPIIYYPHVEANHSSTTSFKPQCLNDTYSTHIIQVSILQRRKSLVEFYLVHNCRPQVALCDVFKDLH